MFFFSILLLHKILVFISHVASNEIVYFIKITCNAHGNNWASISVHVVVVWIFILLILLTIFGNLKEVAMSYAHEGIRKMQSCNLLFLFFRNWKWTAWKSMIIWRLKIGHSIYPVKKLKKQKGRLIMSFIDFHPFMHLKSAIVYIIKSSSL